MIHVRVPRSGGKVRRSAGQCGGGFIGDVEVSLIVRVDLEQLLVDLLNCSGELHGWATRGGFDLPGQVDDFVALDWGSVGFLDGCDLFGVIVIHVSVRLG